MSAIELHVPTSSAGRAAPAAPGGEPLDVIFIEGFEHPTLIGIHAAELDTPQPVRIDLAAGVSRCAACDSDRIDDTIDYGEVREALHRLLQTHRRRLLEGLAEDIARLLLHGFGAHWVRVVLVKPHKFPDLRAVGVAIERRREVVPARAVPVLSLIGSGMVPALPRGPTG